MWLLNNSTNNWASKYMHIKFPRHGQARRGTFSNNAYAFFKAVAMWFFYCVFVSYGYRNLKFIARRESQLFGEIIFFGAVERTLDAADYKASEAHSLCREGDVLNRYSRVDLRPAEALFRAENYYRRRVVIKVDRRGLAAVFLGFDLLNDLT